MARKQADYLATLLADEAATEPSATERFPGETPEPALAPARPRGSLLTRDTALARVASGEVRQVKGIAREQADVRDCGAPALPAADVLRRLLAAPAADAPAPAPAPVVWTTPKGRRAITVQSSNRSGVTVRLHAGWGAGRDESLWRTTANDTVVADQNDAVPFEMTAADPDNDPLLVGTAPPGFVASLRKGHWNAISFTTIDSDPPGSTIPAVQVAR